MKKNLKIIDLIKQRVAQTGDSEPEQIGVRLFIGIFLVLYFCFPWSENETFASAISTQASLIALSFYLGAVLIAVALLLKPKRSPGRLASAILLDLVPLSIGMSLVGDETVFIFCFYLWVILGNGFRFGVIYLYVAMVVAVISFSLAVSWGEYWQTDHGKTMAISLLFLLIVIPGYCSFLIKKLHVAIDSARQANKAKTRFLANMSHELRTPLNGVIGMGDLLRETDLNTEQKKIVSTMHSSAHTLLELIEKVLDISKIESGKLVVKKAELDLHGLVNGVMAVQQPMGLAKGLSVSLTMDSGVPARLIGDEQHIRQVLINIICNAIKFTDKGTVHLKVRCNDEEEGEVSLRFEVQDTGIGIDEHALTQVFDDFTQVGNSVERTVGGTGLGTTIAKELVEIMGGSIGVQSRIGKGSTFWFELPFSLAAEGSKALIESSVLVLSSAHQLQSVTPLFQQWCLGFGHADTPEKAILALEHAEERGEAYQVILVDRFSLGHVQPIALREASLQTRLVGPVLFGVSKRPARRAAE